MSASLAQGRPAPSQAPPRAALQLRARQAGQGGGTRGTSRPASQGQGRAWGRGAVRTGIGVGRKWRRYQEWEVDEEWKCNEIHVNVPVLISEKPTVYLC